MLQVSASKPNYETGAKASVSLKPKQKLKQASWSLAADDDDELLDDDDLLTEEDKQRPVILGIATVQGLAFCMLWRPGALVLLSLCCVVLTATLAA